MFFLETFGTVTLRVLEGIFSVVFGLTVILPLFLFLWSVNTVARLLVGFHLRYHLTRTLRLSDHGLDNIWGYRTVGNSRMVLNVVVYESQIDAGQYAKQFFEQVIQCQVKGQLVYGKLQEKFVDYGGFYCWEKHDQFDLRDHVVVHDSGQEVMDERGLMTLLGSLAEDMSPKQPQWQEVIVPKFKYDLGGQEPVRTVRILRFHHAYGDAGSWLLLYSHCMADGRIPYAVNPLKGYAVPRWQLVLYYVSTVIFGPSTFLRTLWHSVTVPRNRFRAERYSGLKFFAWKRIPVEIVKRIKVRTVTSVPAVVTTALAAALVRFHRTFPDPSKSPLPDTTDCALVAAILPYPNIRLRNRFAIANLNCSTVPHLSRISRLKTTHHQILSLARNPQPMTNFWAMSFFGRFPIRVQNLCMNWASTSVVFSNLPGASESFRLHNVPLEEGGAWIPMLTTAGLTISASGYRNYIRFCASTDSSIMTESQLESFLETVIDELGELGREAGSKVEV